MDDETKLPPPPSSPHGALAGRRPRVLLVDDDIAVSGSFARALQHVASSIALAHDAAQALARLEDEELDVVVSDVSMPGMSGTDLLREVRARDPELPVILVTGDPDVASAATAVELGAFRYLTKPVAIDVLRLVVEEAGRLRSLSRAGEGDARHDLAGSLRNVLSTMRMVYQPIVDAVSRTTVGYEALVRSSDATLATPFEMLAAAERLGMLHVLGRRIRSLVASHAAAVPRGCAIGVNVHAADLTDDELHDPRAPLSAHARRVVLELNERVPLESVPDLDRRLASLRAIGYRVAVDDLGTRAASPSCVTKVRPRIVKVDGSLVRGMDRDPINHRVVRSLAELATDLGIIVVAEGVETPGERKAALDAGCRYLQGHLFARPAERFPAAQWGEG